jgi:hypothetical protein
MSDYLCQCGLIIRVETLVLASAFEVGARQNPAALDRERKALIMPMGFPMGLPPSLTSGNDTLQSNMAMDHHG